MSRRHHHGGRYTPPQARRYPLSRAADGWRLLDPDHAVARRRLDRLGPLGDQLEAALGEQLGILRWVLQDDVRRTTSMPTWARTATRRWADGGRALCAHLRRARGPEPLWLPAWSPTIRCTICLAAAHLEIKGTAEDGTCDGCRRQVGTVWPTAVTVGNLSIVGGCCDSCHSQDVAAEETA